MLFGRLTAEFVVKVRSLLRLPSNLALACRDDNRISGRALPRPRECEIGVSRDRPHLAVFRHQEYELAATWSDTVYRIKSE